MCVKMKELLQFKRMLTPALIQVVFWIGLVYVLFAAFWAMFHMTFIKGLWLLIFGPILLRIICEIFIVIFRVNENVVEIKTLLSSEKSK